MTDQHRDIARIGIVEKLPGAFVEHVGVEAVGLQESDAALPSRAFGLGGVEFALEVGDPLVEVLLGQDAAIAGVGVGAKIADEQRGQGIEAECSQERANPWANDHGAISAASTVKARLTGMISRRCKKTGVAHACAQTFFHKQKPPC